LSSSGHSRKKPSLVLSSEVHSARSVVLFSIFLKAERNVRFNSFALAPSIFGNELVARFPDRALRRQLLKRACRIVRAPVSLAEMDFSYP
jgi:hypothetical protein